MDRPQIARGDWFLTPRNVEHCCRMRLLPGEDPPIGTVPGLTYLGPVHESKDDGDYTAILVPSPRHDLPLVWITVYCARNQRGDPNYPVHFARKLDATMVNQWKRSGWTNRFLDEASHEGDESSRPVSPPRFAPAG